MVSDFRSYVYSPSANDVQKKLNHLQAYELPLILKFKNYSFFIKKYLYLTFFTIWF
jgi:hypothetical protein